MGKPKVAIYWCASCGGCEEAVVDLNEFILDVVAAVDIILWPVAMDFKYDDIRSMKDGEIDVSLINGAIRTSEQEELARLLRRKSKMVISVGACAMMGGIPGLANFYDKDSILKCTYIDTQSTVNLDKIFPKEKSEFEGKELEIPEFYKRVYSLDQVIDVDYYIPGCPPTPEVIKNALLAILEGKLPKKGSILTENKSLCNDCPRNETKPETISIKEFKRPHEVMDNGKCFIEQGVICIGLSTRMGCGAKCIKANMPCRGCFGPTDNALESGSEAFSAIASIIQNNNEEEVKKIIDTIADPAGLFYRYSLAKSIMENENKEK